MRSTINFTNYLGRNNANSAKVISEKQMGQNYFSNIFIKAILLQQSTYYEQKDLIGNNKQTKTTAKYSQ